MPSSQTLFFVGWAEGWLVGKEEHQNLPGTASVSTACARTCARAIRQPDPQPDSSSATTITKKEQKMKHRPIALAIALSMAAFVAVQLYIVTVFFDALRLDTASAQPKQPRAIVQMVEFFRRGKIS